MARQQLAKRFRLRPQSAALFGPRASVLLGALILEAALLAFWPGLYLAGPTSGPTTFGQMMLRFVPASDAVLWTVKGAIDVLFPGALWTREAVVPFFFHAIMLAFVGYAFAVWRMARQPLPFRWVLVPLIVFQITLFALPAIMTTDIYSYTLYGEMPVVYGANPFTHTPSEFPQSTLHYLIPQYWQDAPSVYGPLWIVLSSGVAALLHGRPLIDELLVYRLLGNLAHLANTLIIWRLARRFSPSAGPAAALAYAWSPLALIEFSLNAHNDSLMLTFLLLAVRFAATGRLALCALLVGLSAATKYTSILAAPMLFVWAAQAGDRGQRTGDRGATPSPLAGEGWGEGARALRALVVGSAISLGTVFLFYLPWVHGLDTLGPVLYWVTGPRLNDFWPEPALRGIAALVGGLFGLDPGYAFELLLGPFKVLAKIGLVALIGWELRTLRQRTRDRGQGTGEEIAEAGPQSSVLSTPHSALRIPHSALPYAALASCVRIFIFFLLLVNTWIMPWYYAWPLALAAPLGWQSLTARICAGLGVTALIVMYQRQIGYAVVSDWGGLTLVLPILLGLAPGAWNRGRRWFERPEPKSTEQPEGLRS